MPYPPQFFDILGVFVFLFIAVSAFWSLKTGRSFPVWMIWLLLTIGIVGLIVDGTIVYTFYLQ